MKKLIPIIFSIVAVCLFVLFIMQEKHADSGEPQIIMPRTVIPENANRDAEAAQTDAYEDDETFMTSLIPLRANEMLIGTLSTDFNNDGHDDQINAVKQSGNSSIILLVGIYNPNTQTYRRAAEIDTGIVQVSAFSYTAMDVTGDHRTALIYSGTASGGGTIMKIFRGVTRGGQFALSTIGDFASDGTIFIQQLDRYDSYDQNLSQGASFPVWVYSSDGDAESSDQLQTMYTWNAAVGRYVRQSETRVTGTKLESEEINRILDGNADTFTEFLHGMWYKTSNTDEGIRYLHFNANAHEITFLLNDTGESYTWVESSVHRNGIYLTAINSSISNLTRRFDISLTGVDEIKLTLQDDVRMIISEGTLWDGQYKKLGQGTAVAVLHQSETAEDRICQSGCVWQAGDGTAVTFSSGSYTAQNGGYADHGQTAFTSVKNRDIVQFRSDTDSAFFNGFYLISYHDAQNEGETDVLTLEPVELTPLDYTLLPARAIRLTPIAETPAAG